MTLRELKRAGVLLLITAGLFLFPFLAGKTFFVGDKTYSFQPWLTYVAQEIQAGRFPLWNPYSACGEPMVGNPQLMLFSPTAIVYWLFPFCVADPLFLFLSQTWLFLFTYLLARKWIGQPAHHHSAVHAPAALAALAFAWGGYAVGYWEFPSAIGTLPFLPLFFLLGMGESWAALTAATAMVLGTGYIQFAYYAIVCGLAGTLHAILTRPRKTMASHMTPLASMAGAVGIGVMMGMAQILPSWESARHSLRAGMAGTDVKMHLMTPIFLIKLWIPWLTNTVALAFQSNPFGPEFWPIQRNWLTTIFLGTPVCLLAMGGLCPRIPRLERDDRRQKPGQKRSALVDGKDRSTEFFGLRIGIGKGLVLGSVVAISAVLSFGVDPFFGWARALVPGFRYLTHFSNAAVLGLLCLILISTEMAPPRRDRNVLLILATLFVLTTGLALAFLPPVRKYVLHAYLGISSLTPSQDRWVMEAGGITATTTLCFAGVWLFFRHKRWAVLWCFTLLELWALGRTLQPWGPHTFFHQPLALAKIFADSPHRFSISPATMKTEKILGGNSLVAGYQSAREAFYPNVSLPFRVHHTWSYEVFGFQEFTEFRRRLPDLPDQSPPLDFLGASFLMTTKPLPPPALPIARAENALLYARPTALARVSVVPRAFALSSGKERLDYLFGPWNPQKEVVVEENVPSKPGSPKLESWEEKPGRVTAQGAGAGWLVYSGIFFPGWESYVNGKKATLLRANHAFQTVATPENPWRVHLIYRPKWFRIGIGLTVLTTFCFIAILGIKGTQIPRRTPWTIS